MSIKIQSACWPLDLPPTQKLVLICLADFADDSGRCYPSAATIAQRTGFNERSVRRAINDLEKAGHLSRLFCTGKRTDYIINPCQSVTTDTVSPLTENTRPLTQCPIPLTENTNTPDRGVNITIIEPSLTITKPSLVNKPVMIDADYIANAFEVDKQIATDWLLVRKHKKAPPLSPTALKLLEAESRKAGITPAQAIARAAGSGWISFKASYGSDVSMQSNGAAHTAGSNQW